MKNFIKNLPEKQAKALLFILLFISGSIALAGVLIMTDAGQIFGINRDIIVNYFENNAIYIFISFVLLAVVILINWHKKFIKRSIIISLSIMWILAILATKYITPYVLFRTHQDNAKYVSIDEAKDYLVDDDVVFVIDRNGEQKAYPTKYIWQTHIVGGDFGDDNVLFTYCVLTNLPSPYLNDLDGEPMDLKVLAQANNNLLLWERNSGEIIQQINHTCEFSKRQLSPIPVLEMTWAGYKKLFPRGKVFYNQFDTPIEKVLNLLMSTEDTHYGEKFMFNTVNLDDKRLPSKEQIIGIKENNENIAITKSFIKEQGTYAIKIGDKRIILTYFPEYETIAAFNGIKDGTEIDITEIDAFGNTPEFGQLDREFVYNSVLWAVWAYYHPDSKIIK